ncbi:MAG: sigma 54-interacting transcriptional regulator [Chloroflexota bacterium]|nr:sigma 54-interacting transcriptional regulator [Chloroflexota bacterium]
MRACLELARIASQSDVPVLILGESGTGKTILARAIHNSSARAPEPFVCFNAAALSDMLLDSQLFGHEHGAFAGAVQTVKGKFELADRGTLFIDEIADVNSAAQAKLLRAVEYGEFERLGSDELHVANVRLISATHLPLKHFVESEHFRKDLFYRLSGITISIPPLRDRPSDLRSLIAAEIASAGRAHGKRIVGISKSAADLLFTYHWPGNLRELKRVVHSVVALSTGNVIQRSAIFLEKPDTRRARGELASEVSDPEPDLTLRRAELRHIHQVLQRMGGNKRRTAKALGVSRATLDRKLSSKAAGDPSNMSSVTPE